MIVPADCFLEIWTELCDRCNGLIDTTATSFRPNVSSAKRHGVSPVGVLANGGAVEAVIIDVRRERREEHVEVFLVCAVGSVIAGGHASCPEKWPRLAGGEAGDGCENVEEEKKLFGGGHFGLFGSDEE